MPPQASYHVYEYHLFSFSKPCSSHVVPHAIPCTTQYCKSHSSSLSSTKNILQMRFTAPLTKSLILNIYTKKATVTINPAAIKRVTTSPITGAIKATIATSIIIRARNRSMNSTNPHATSPYSNERLSTSNNL